MGLAVALAVLLAFTGAAGAQASRQIVVEPREQEGQPAPPPPQPATPPSPPTAASPAPSQACAERKFIEPEAVVAQMAADLDRVRTRAKGTRYLTLTHFVNVCVSEETMEVYRQGAIKLVNSLSRSSDVVRIEPIDAERSILRINIDDLGWNAADWDNLIAAYPYAAQPDTKLFVVLQNATGTKLPYVRADWFAFAAARPPLYNALLKLPKTMSALAQAQGVDIVGNIKKFVVQRAGFQKSGEGPNNRLIERHPSRSGYFWMTYDFAGNRAKQSVFEFPVGPGGANGFDHDGSEVMFSLPNGFQGYFIATAKGDGLDDAPARIARDPRRRDGIVTTGISCMGCHADGIRPVADEVRINVLAARSISREVRDAVEALYSPSERMEQLFADDAKRFADAMARAGLDPALKLDGAEPINALAARFEAMVDTALAASELGLTAKDFLDAVNEGNRKFRALVTRLGQGAVSREEFEGRFTELIDALTDERMIKLDKPAAAVAPAKARSAVPASPGSAAPAAQPPARSGPSYR
jgi:hypothetical protein